jgi:hypothetical protein
MPVKDLLGPPLLTAEDRALLIELHRRLGMPLPRRPGDEGGLEPVPTPSGPKPAPMTGGAAATFQ